MLSVYHGVTGELCPRPSWGEGWLFAVLIGLNAIIGGICKSHSMMMLVNAGMQARHDQCNRVLRVMASSQAKIARCSAPVH